MQSTVTTPKKLIVARFDEGEDLLLTLKKCAEKHNITSGYFQIIGGLSKLKYGILDEKGGRKVFEKEAKNCIEILTTQGNISLQEGEAVIHAHIAAAEEGEGLVYGGHLVEGSIIHPFAEVFIQEIDGEFSRKFCEKTNLWPLNILNHD